MKLLSLSILALLQDRRVAALIVGDRNPSGQVPSSAAAVLAR